MIFFDIDGTLFDQETAEKLAAIRFFKENMTDLQVNQKEFVAIRDVYHNNFQIYLLKGFSPQERNRMIMRDLIAIIYQMKSLIKKQMTFLCFINKIGSLFMM